MAVDIEEIKLIIRSLLISHKDPPSINILRSDFKESEGRDIPFTNLGYTSILDFLQSLRDTVVVLPDKTVKAVATAEVQHLLNLVSKQRKAKSSKRTKRARTYHSRSLYTQTQKFREQKSTRQRNQSSTLSRARYSDSKTNYDHGPQSSFTSPTMELYDTPSSHTILLVQPGSPDTRTYSDYKSVNECMEAVCKIYEEHLKKQYPSTPYITYDIYQLFDFLDQLADLSCLVYQGSTNTYEPCNKDWIKEKIYSLFKWAA